MEAVRDARVGHGAALPEEESILRSEPMTRAQPHVLVEGRHRLRAEGGDARAATLPLRDVDGALVEVDILHAQPGGLVEAQPRIGHEAEQGHVAASIEALALAGFE